ncbi:MAG: phage tail sheath C-terminal domain-containing protein, partial [Rudaea sp.]
YIQEEQSPVHTITPVDTATTAFIGSAKRGPVNEPTICNSFGDFDQIFGGLWLDSNLGYAVSDFFLNGGSKAIIVRVYNPADPQPTTDDAIAAAGKATLPIGGLNLRAKSPGIWGTKLAARITYPDEKIAPQLAKKYEVEAANLLNLTIRDLDTGATEEFDSLTVISGKVRAIDKVIASESDLVEFVGALPTPSPTSPPPRPDKSNDPPTGKGPWDDPSTYYQIAQPGADGKPLDKTALSGNLAAKTGIYALEHADIFNLLCIPPYKDADDYDVDVDVLQAAAVYCEKRRAMLIVDPPLSWKSKADAIAGYPIPGLPASANAAVFFPRVYEQNPLRENRVEPFVPSGAVAGVMARTDLQRGVWKAAAGLEAGLRGVIGPTIPLTDAENGQLNPLGINCLRTLPAAGNVVWGARTMVGDDRLASQWKYVPVRRTALFIEESLYRGTQWAVFEPNDEPLWSQLRLNIGVFMHDLFRQGAFQGQSPQEAYFVKCDATTTTQVDRDRGIVSVIVGFAPLKPAEFVILHIQQIAGQLEV